VSVQLIDEFNTTNSYSITVQGQYIGGYSQLREQVISTTKSNGDLPNIVVGYPNDFAEYARYGKIRFLDDYLNDPAIGTVNLSDFYPGMIDYYRLSQYGNQLSGLQHGRSIEIMYYNADMLSSAGITVPTTWDTFETAVISITTNTVSGTIPSIDASRFATWLWSRGGDLLANDLKHARFHEQPGIDSLLLFQNLINAGYARLGDRYLDGVFGNGEVGFTFSSSSAIPYYRSSMENGVQQAWGVARVPALSGNEVVDSYGGGLAVLHHSEAEDLASWRFIWWLAEREQTARWAALSGYFPVRVSAETHISMTQKLASDPQYAQAHALLPLGRTELAIRDYNTIRAILANAMDDILRNGANVTTTLQIAATEVDNLLAESGPSSATIPPEGGTLVYTNTQGLSVSIKFPPNSVATTQTVSYVPLNDLPSDGLAFALVPDLTFTQPVTITLNYRNSDVTGMDENTLKLYQYDWATSSWVDANPCGGYVREPENNILQAAVCHFSDYGLRDGGNKIYLPVIIKSG